MQKQALIIYDSESGSTVQAAEIIKNEISKNYAKVDIFHTGRVDNITEYDMIIVGSPNWYGKPTKNIQKFLKNNNNILIQKSFAFFFTAMCLTKIAGEDSPDLSVYDDPQFNITPIPVNKMGIWEKSHAASFYRNQLKKIIPNINPVSVAVFKGRLNFSRLSFFHKILMKVISKIIKDVKPGEYIWPDVIRDWAKKI